MPELLEYLPEERLTDSDPIPSEESPSFLESLNPKHGIAHAARALQDIRAGKWAHGIAGVVNGVGQAASAPLLGLGMLTDPVMTLGGLAAWKYGAQPLIDKATEKFGLDPEVTNAAALVGGAFLGGHGEPIEEAALGHANRLANDLYPHIARGTITPWQAAKTITSELHGGFKVEVDPQHIHDQILETLNDYSQPLPGTVQANHPQMQMFADTGLDRLATFSRHFDNGFSRWDQINPRTILYKDGKSVPFGKITHDDRLQSMSDWLSPEEIQYASQWYKRAKPFFYQYFPENPEREWLAWALGNANASPSDAMGNKFIAADRVAGRPNTGEKFFGRPDPEPGTQGEWQKQVLRGEAATGGAQGKLNDFPDSIMGNEDRTFVGGDPRGMRPWAHDRWDWRAAGKIDETTLNWLNKEFPDHSLIWDRKDGPDFRGPQYEWGVRQGNDLTDHANDVAFNGRDSWTPAELQAVDWYRVQKMMGKDPGDIADLLNDHTRRISMGLDLGNDAPLRQHGITTIPEDVAREMVQAVHDLFGPSSNAIRHLPPAKLGAYMLDREPSIQPEIASSARTAEDMAAALGYLGQQTEMLGTHAHPEGNGYAIDLIDESPNQELGTDAATGLLHVRLLDAGADPAVVAGFQPHEVDGKPGMRFVHYDGDAGAFDGHFTKDQIANLQAAVDRVKADHGYNISVEHRPVETFSSGNDWKEDPDGEGYLSWLEGRGRVQEAASLRDHLGPRFIQKLKALSGPDQGGSGLGGPGGPAQGSEGVAGAALRGGAPQEVGGIAGLMAPEESGGITDALKKPGGELGTTVPFDEDAIRAKLIHPEDQSWNPQARAMFHPGEGPGKGILFGTQEAVNELRGLGRFFYPDRYTPARLVHGFAMPAEEAAAVRQALYNGFSGQGWLKPNGDPLPKFFQDKKYQQNVLGPYLDALMDSPNPAVAAINPTGAQWTPSQIAYHEGVVHRGQFALDTAGRSSLDHLLPADVMDGNIGPVKYPALTKIRESLAATYHDSHIPAEMGAWLGSDMWHQFATHAEAKAAALEYVKALIGQHGDRALPLANDILRGPSSYLFNEDEIRDALNGGIARRARGGPVPRGIIGAYERQQATTYP